MTWRTATAGLFLLAVAAGRAEEPAAPLANSARELKTLQRDQTTRNSGVTRGNLTEGLPRMQGPTPGEQLLELPKPRQSESETRELKRKKDTQKNWLVDGVDQLGKGSGSKNRGARNPKETGLAGEEEGTPDPSDPDYILKLYREQQKEMEARAGARQPAAPQPDPFAPFLQGWLGTTPARGKFFDESIRKPESGLGGIAPGGQPVSASSQVFNTVEVPGSSRVTVVEAPPNPYLQGLDLPSLGATVGNPVPEALNLGGPARLPDSQPAAMPGGTPPAARTAERKPPPSAQADDNKYFPQLKRF